MAFWYRSGGTKRLRSLLFLQCTRWLGTAHRTMDQRPRIGSPIERRAVARFTPVRSFAAPVSSKKAKEKEKEKEKGSSAPRTNEEIVALYVRLVTDEGHGIITRKEALDRARKLDLDLVEVSRDADPPVCKIMDFHKEKFKKQAKIKELAKAKTDSSLRKGDCKEVKFTGKIEHKDLELKAETVKRLVEHGYRVKVIAEAGKQSGAADTGKEDLSKVLSRLYSLIEEFSALESPPLVNQKMAYLIVRHAKFGTKKNHPSKKSTDSDVKGSGPHVKHSNSHQAVVTSKEVTELPKISGIEAEIFHMGQPSSHIISCPAMVNFKSKLGHSDGKAGPCMTEMKSNSKAVPRDGRVPPVTSSVKPVLSPELSNRYKKTGPSQKPTGRIALQPSFVKPRDESLSDSKQCNSIPGNTARTALFSFVGNKEQNCDNTGRMHKPPPDLHRPPKNLGVFRTPRTGNPNINDSKQNAEKNASEKGLHSQPKGESRERDWGIFSR